MLFGLFIITSLMLKPTISQNGVGVTNKLNVSATYGVTWILGQFADPAELNYAGEDFTVKLYVARARVNGEWVPGKGFFNGKTFYAVVPYDRRETLIADNQALLGGDVRWIPMQKSCQLPPLAIVAGIDPKSRRTEYVCRGFVFEGGKPWLIVGKYVEDLFACRVPFYGEVPVSSFEILVEAWSGLK